jgi:predicted kinase
MDVLIPRIIAIGGAVGAGKSSVARLLRDRLAGCAGLEPDSRNSFRLLRSDVLRKQLLDIDPLSRLPGKYYENEQYSRLIYNTLHEVARIAVDAGDFVLLDATYTRRWQRAALEAVVGRSEFQGYWLEANLDERLQRLTIRSNDPSDASPDFAAEQHIERPVNEARWKYIEVSSIPLDELAETLAGRICGDKPK